MKILDTLRSVGRHARHDFAEGRETVAQMIARIDAMPVEPAYAHRIAPDEYPTAVLPVYAVRQIEQRAASTMLLVEATGLEVVEVNGGRPMHDLDYIDRMNGGAR